MALELSDAWVVAYWRVTPSGLLYCKSCVETGSVPTTGLRPPYATEVKLGHTLVCDECGKAALIVPRMHL